MEHFALGERRALSETLRRAGPAAPTLCGHWTTTELAAHLVLRERSAVELAGRLPVERWQDRAEAVVSELAAAAAYGELVDAVERGPRWNDLAGPVPVAWLWSLPAVREQANLLEYLVHHEDVRRAADGWGPRAVTPAFDRAVWSRLRMLTRWTLRRVPVGLELVPQPGPPGSPAPTTLPTMLPTIRTRAARRSGAAVTMRGPVVELTLFAFGRGAQARVEFDGEPAALERVRDADISL